MQEEEFLLLEQGVNDDLLSYDIDVREGYSSLQQKLRQLLIMENTPYTVYQQQSIQNCCQILQRNTIDYLKDVLYCIQFIISVFVNDLMRILLVNVAIHFLILFHIKVMLIVMLVFYLFSSLIRIN